MSKVSGPPYEGMDDPPTQLREFAAKCVELAQTTPSPEKRMMYLKMAALFHQMAPPGNAFGLGAAGGDAMRCAQEFFEVLKPCGAYDAAARVLCALPFQWKTRTEFEEAQRIVCAALIASGWLVLEQAEEELAELRQAVGRLLVS